MEKVMITRKDGIVYERKQKEPTKLTKCLCLRIDEETFNRLGQFGKPCTLIRELIEKYLEKNDEE